MSKLRWIRMSWLTGGLDTLALAAWGVLLLKYWLTGKLSLLIHPHYFGLTIAAGVALLLIAGLYSWQRSHQTATVRHITLFPPGWTSGLLLVTAVVGLTITPRPFASQTAIQRGLSAGAIITRSQPQAFRAATRPESRSLIDWVRTLDVYPEPDAYTGQKVKVEGFVTQTPGLPDRYFTLTRFIITCCAADAYPVGLPVQVAANQPAYAADQWLEVAGQMQTKTLAGKRQLVITASAIKPIAEPSNPYSY